MPIAKGRVFGLLAAAQPGFSILLCDEGQWRESGASVRTVTERLILRATTAAPIVFLAGFQFDRDRFVRGNNGFQDVSPFLGPGIPADTIN